MRQYPKYIHNTRKYNERIEEQHYEGGYRSYGDNYVIENYLRHKKNGVVGKRWGTQMFSYTRLWMCERCGKIGGRNRIRQYSFNLEEFHLFGYFCLGCQNTLRSLERAFRENDLINREIKKLKGEINARVKNYG